MPHTETRLRSAVILLVEDRKMDIELTLDAFQKARLSNRVEVVTNGDDALDYLLGEGKFADRDAYPIPDLVLLDLSLPGTNGHEVLETVKSTPVLKRIPIVILTSSHEDFDRATCYDRGANSYLVKPVSFEAFCRAVQEIHAYWMTLNVEPPINQ